MEDPIDEVRSDEETSSSDQELEDYGDSESCGEDGDEADGSSDDDDDTTGSQSHPRGTEKQVQSKGVRFQEEDKAQGKKDASNEKKGSATRASCKDQAGDEQGNKDDHGDGGANDGDNKQP